MPYKDSDQAREAARLRKQKQRSHPDVTPANVTPDVTLLSRPNRLGADGTVEMVDNLYDPTEVIVPDVAGWDGITRYVTCHDGQGLDRLTVGTGWGMMEE